MGRCSAVTWSRKFHGAVFLYMYVYLHFSAFLPCIIVSDICRFILNPRLHYRRDNTLSMCVLLRYRIHKCVTHRSYSLCERARASFSRAPQSRQILKTTDSQKPKEAAGVKKHRREKAMCNMFRGLRKRINRSDTTNLASIANTQIKSVWKCYFSRLRIIFTYMYKFSCNIKFRIYANKFASCRSYNRCKKLWNMWMTDMHIVINKIYYLFRNQWKYTYTIL